MAWGSGYKQPNDWRTTRARILDRDGHMCRTTGCTRQATSVDHITSVAAGGTHDDENLVAICWPHKRIKDEADRKAGIARRQASRKRTEQHPGAL